MDFKFTELELKGAFLIEAFHVGDSRGFFCKTFEKEIFKRAGIEFRTNEAFVSSSMKNVIRGIHFQTNKPQAKIVSVISGRIWDVIVDLRPRSSTYKQWYAHELSSENYLSLYVPKGFGHGFASLEDDSVVLYLCDGVYDKETDTGIIFNESELGIAWPIDEGLAIHSSRDLLLKSLSDYEKSPMILS